MRIVYAWIVLVLFFLAMVIGFLTTGHAATTSKQHNGLGVLMYQENPYSYLVIDKVTDIQSVEGNLSLRVHPMWTYMLFDQNLLFCGLPMEKFRGITAPFVITYERQAHRSVQGVGCHYVFKVDEVTVSGGLK